MFTRCAYTRIGIRPDTTHTTIRMSLDLHIYTYTPTYSTCSLCIYIYYGWPPPPDLHLQCMSYLMLEARNAKNPWEIHKTTNMHNLCLIQTCKIPRENAQNSTKMQKIHGKLQNIHGKTKKKPNSQNHVGVRHAKNPRENQKNQKKTKFSEPCPSQTCKKP